MKTVTWVEINTLKIPTCPLPCSPAEWQMSHHPHPENNFTIGTSNLEGPQKHTIWLFSTDKKIKQFYNFVKVLKKTSSPMFFSPCFLVLLQFLGNVTSKTNFACSFPGFFSFFLGSEARMGLEGRGGG